MSLASSPDYLIRPEEQALKLLFPSVDQTVPNSFDDFFDQELYDTSSSDEIVKTNNEEACVNVFNPDSYNLTNDYSSKHSKASQFEQSPPQPWRKGLWCLNQQSGSQLMIEKTRKANIVPPSDILPVHLIPNDNFAIRSPRPADLRFDTKSPSTRCFQKLDSHSSPFEQRLTRDMSLSPSPMYSRPVYNERNDFIDAWQQDFQQFSLNGSNYSQENFTLKENHRAEQSGNRNSRTNVIGGQKLKYVANQAAETSNTSETMSYAQEDKNASHGLSAIAGTTLNAANRNMFSNTPDRVDQTFRFINQDIPAMSDWTATESLHSSNSSYNSHTSHTSSENHVSGLYHNLPLQDWSSTPSTDNQIQQVQKVQDNLTQIHQPTPRRAIHHTLDSADTEEYGLGVTYPSLDEIGIAIPYHPLAMHTSAVASAYTGYHRKSSHQIGRGCYPTIPPPIDHFSETSPFTAPHRCRPIRTPSPSISPSRISSRHRSPTRREPSSSHHRRKSLHKSGPIKPSNTGPETPRHRSTSRSRSRPPRTPKTPKTPGGVSADNAFNHIGFVNFTPKDADRLLNDVAPSGSSKTRARREQEAREKRKKLSEAALEAVRRAGGDVEALEKAILT